jgi:hypothetical protein
MSCPYTSQQNGRAERSLRTINNILRSLLFQASLPSVYWVEALHTATYLVNRLPTKTLTFSTPYTSLYSTQPSYDHLRVFWCACYPNMSSTVPHKLAPRSSLCIFLGYSSEHKGYRCLELQSNRIIISRHVVFDESFFPFSDMSTTPMAPSALDFLIDEDDLTTSVPGTRFVHPGTTPHAVHGTVPVHGTVAAPELLRGSPDLDAAVQAATSSASSTPVQPGAAAPVHCMQVAASSTAPTASSSTAGTAARMSACKPCSTLLTYTPNYLLMALQMQTPHSIVAWLVLCSISPSPVLTLLSSFNRFASICMTLGNHILLPSNGFYTTYRALFPLV